MAQIQSHRDLTVWHKSMDLVEVVYSLTKAFPDQEKYRLVHQATRAAVAVPANLAEGHARGTRKEYAQFVAIARGSLMELETYVMLAERLHYTGNEEATGALERIAEVSRMLTALRLRLIELRT